MIGPIIPMHHVKTGEQSTADRNNTKKQIHKLKETCSKLLNSLKPFSAYVLLFRAAFCILLTVASESLFCDLDAPENEEDLAQWTFYEQWTARLKLCTFIQLSASWLVFQLLPIITIHLKWVHMCYMFLGVALCFNFSLCVPMCFYMYMVLNGILSCLLDVRYALFMIVSFLDVAWDAYNLKEALSICGCENHKDEKELSITFGTIEKKIGGRCRIDEKILKKTFDNIPRTPLFLFNKDGKKIFTFYDGKFKYLSTGKYILKTASQLSEDQKGKKCIQKE